ncbi:hypothetical protein Taro_015551 [Colocasia esculenta]|uniref:Uncharacterized protein n=1 Tax=Colocasia esculenta TaxID=4460 RepID=A0A843UMM6_COLES|nr:hypothetical protein [Colocasia esculenta]
MERESTTTHLKGRGVSLKKRDPVGKSNPTGNSTKVRKRRGSTETGSKPPHGVRTGQRRSQRPGSPKEDPPHAGHLDRASLYVQVTNRNRSTVTQREYKR